MLTHRMLCTLGWANTATAGKKSITLPVLTSITTDPEVKHVFKKILLVNNSGL